MVKRPRGYFSRATRKLRAKRKLTPANFIKEFTVGQRVLIKPQPYYKSAIPHRRYRGKAGKVIERRGSCYVVELKDGGKIKQVIAHPVHLILLPSPSEAKA